VPWAAAAHATTCLSISPPARLGCPVGLRGAHTRRLDTEARRSGGTLAVRAQGRRLRRRWHHLQATPIIISTPKPLLTLVRHLGGTDRLHSRRALGQNGAELTKLAAGLQARPPPPKTSTSSSRLTSPRPRFYPRREIPKSSRAFGRRWCSTRRTCCSSRASSPPLGCRAARPSRRAAERGREGGREGERDREREVGGCMDAHMQRYKLLIMASDTHDTCIYPPAYLSIHLRTSSPPTECSRPRSSRAPPRERCRGSSRRASSPCPRASAAAAARVVAGEVVAGEVVVLRVAAVVAAVAAVAAEEARAARSRCS
jgi:hypothetical protein